MNKKYTADEADKLVTKWATILTTSALLFVNVCLPALVIGGILYFVFGR
jgi:hypothetical protein